jgi:hypothetical protein
MRIYRLAAVIAGMVAGLLAHAGNALAAEAAPDFDPSRSYAIRFQIPYAGLMAAGGGSNNWNIEGVEVVAGSVGARFAHLYEVEVAGSRFWWICGSGAAVQARAGVSPSLIKARAEGTHWNLRVPILLGFLDKSGGNHGCDGLGNNDLRGMLLSTGLDATHWSSSGLVGFNIRLLFGMGPGWSKEVNYGAKDGKWERAGAILETSLMIGMAFH